MPWIPDPLTAYSEQATTPPPEHLRRVAEEARAHLTMPQMLSGPVEGRLLELLAWTARAERVLEIGTYAGFSALSMAAALPPHGRVVSLEHSAEHAAFARRHIEGSPYAKQVEIVEGDAAETLPTLSGPFELIFVDADKVGYPRYVDLALPLLADHGLLVLDNTMLGGHVLPGEDDGGEATATMRELNARLARDPELVCVFLTVRDGVTLVRRR